MFTQIAAFYIIGTKNNQSVYGLDDVVDYYAGQGDLQKPEATILNEFRNKLPNMSMLDIGVGAGRTTLHFAKLAKEYSGIDYSDKMIKGCIERFKDFPQKICFVTADARSMKLFKDRSFDFVLFSFNGIDYMDHEDRITTLHEIHRIIKNGGYFCFSTHNLKFFLEKCSIQLSKHPTILVMRIFRLLQMRLLNNKEAWKVIRSSSRNLQHCMVNDGALNFRLKTYYITPAEQLKQLIELGYSDTKMYSLTNGREIKNPSKAVDHWLYYLSKVA